MFSQIKNVHLQYKIIPLGWERPRLALDSRAYFLYDYGRKNKQRVIIYIDGFNFYYGLKTAPWKKYYWLDIVKLMESFLRPNQELIAVKYFSARPTDVGKRKRQDAFFQANKENPKFKLILGKYLKRKSSVSNATISSILTKKRSLTCV